MSRTIDIAAELRAEPFVAWLNAEYDKLAHLYEEEMRDAGRTERALSPTQQLAQRLGFAASTVGARRLYRLRNSLRAGARDGVKGDFPTDTYPRTMIEDALDHAGVAIEELYPELAEDIELEPDAYCWACEENVTPINAACPWCDNTDLRPPVVKKKRRWKRPDRTATAKLTDRQLRALHVIYQRDNVSVNDIAKQVWQAARYKNYESCARGIYKGWDRLALPRRDRIDAVRLKCTVHGMAPKHGSRRREYRAYLRAKNGDVRPRCKGTLRGHPGHGRQCERPAMHDSEYCQAHDPRLELARQAHLAHIRRLQPVKEVVPMAPFTAWLMCLRAEHGSLGKVADLVGLERSQCYRYAKGRDTVDRPKTEITRELVERCARNADTTIEVIYGQAASVAA